MSSQENIFYAKDWEYGLRCMTCDHEFSEGEVYSERLDGFVDDTPAVAIICAPCAMKAAL